MFSCKAGNGYFFIENDSQLFVVNFRVERDMQCFEGKRKDKCTGNSALRLLKGQEKRNPFPEAVVR